MSAENRENAEKKQEKMKEGSRAKRAFFFCFCYCNSSSGNSVGGDGDGGRRVQRGIDCFNFPVNCIVSLLPSPSLFHALPGFLVFFHAERTLSV